MPRSLPNLFSQETAAASQDQLYHLIIVDGIKSATATEEPLYLVDSNYDVTYAGQLYTRFPLKFSGIAISSDGTIDKASITISNITSKFMDLVEQYDGLSGATVSVIAVYGKFLDYTYTYNVDGSSTIAPSVNADPTAHIRDEFTIDSYTANEQTIVFQLNAVVDFVIQVPRRRLTPNACYWKYNDPETCGHVGVQARAWSSLFRIPNSVASLYKYTSMVGRAVEVFVGSTLTHTSKVTAVGTDVSNVDIFISIETPHAISYDTVVYLKLSTCKKTLLDCQCHDNSHRFGGFPGIPSDTRRIYL